jgi:hypothetical protein
MTACCNTWGNASEHFRRTGFCQSCATRQRWAEGAYACAHARRYDRWTPEEQDRLRALAGGMPPGAAPRPRWRRV